MRISYPKTDPLLSSSMQQLELKSSRTFLAIKCSEGTEIGKVIKQSRSLIYKLAHICATRGIPVKPSVSSLSQPLWMAARPRLPSEDLQLISPSCHRSEGEMVEPCVHHCSNFLSVVVQISEGAIMFVVV